ncbi:MAG: hypothetical protein MZU97_08375 [Bacillus subtilis]|nr:hypothetical protein [Bacillus subtilis]
MSRSKMLEIGEERRPRHRIRSVSDGVWGFGHHRRASDLVSGDGCQETEESLDQGKTLGRSAARGLDARLRF